MTPFTITLPHFEGPLDLLLHLIERRELDVTTVSLAAVTDEFLRTIGELERADPDGIADFLVVAAKLVLIKSRMLLPAPPSAEAEEDDEGEELAQALEMYRQFKQVAAHLGEREAQGLRSYARVTPPPDLQPRLDPTGLTLNDLFAALRTVLKEKEPEPENVDTVVRPIRITVRQRIVELTAHLREGKPLAFAEVLGGAPSRQEVIATFLAMLELIKMGWVSVQQEGLWGRIELTPILEKLPHEDAHDPTAEIDEYV
jgi:segregation and condensation protein A